LKCGSDENPGDDTSSTPITPRKSDKENDKAPSKVTPKKARVKKTVENPANETQNGDLKCGNVENLGSPSLQKKDRIKLIISPKSKLLGRHTSNAKSDHHEDSKTYEENRKCTYCEKVFRNDQKLMKHVGKSHQNVDSQTGLNKKTSSDNSNDVEENLNVVRNDKEEEINKAKVAKQKVDNNNESCTDPAVSRSSKKMRLEAERIDLNPISSNSTPNRDIPEQTPTRESPLPSSECSLCEEYINNKSKLRRHQKYVHGVKGTDVKYVEPTEEGVEDVKDEDDSNVIENGNDLTPVENAPLFPSSSEINHPIDPKDNEIKSCLRKLNHSLSKKSVTFNETIFTQEFDKEGTVFDLKKDIVNSAKNSNIINPGDQTRQGQERLPTSVGSLETISKAEVSPTSPTSPAASSPKSPKIKKSKKRKFEDLPQYSKKKQVTDISDNIDKEFESDTELAIKLSLEAANKTGQQKVEHSIAFDKFSDSSANKPTETIVLFPCKPCAISFDNKDDMWQHELVCPMVMASPNNTDSALKETDVNEPDKVINDACNKNTEGVKKGSGRDYSKKRKNSRNTLVDKTTDEKRIHSSKPIKAVQVEKVKPEPTEIKQENLSEALLKESSDRGSGGMVSLPLDSFLETILTEEPLEANLHETVHTQESIGAKLHDAIDTFTAKLKRKSETQSTTLNECVSTVDAGGMKPESHEALSKRTESVLNPDITTISSVPVSVPEVTDTDGLPKSLQLKYRQAAKRVDFTQSNFFMNHAELVGKSVNGAGFTEISNLLPEGWKVKTFNEWKKFYLTPNFQVLKSSMAAIEYLRLAIDLSHDDLKSLSKNLNVVGKQFDRYLDDLYDDCVVLE